VLLRLLFLCCHPSAFSDPSFQPDGSISKEIMPDFVHPSSAGHQIWADAIIPKLTEWMK